MPLYLSLFYFYFFIFIQCPHLYICIVCMYIWLNCIYLYLNVYCQCLMLTVCTRVWEYRNFNSLYVCTVHVEELTIKQTWLDLTWFYTASQLVSICMRCAYFATIGQSFDWREPIGLQERLEGRSSHNGEFSVMSRSRSQGTEVMIVTGDVFPEHSMTSLNADGTTIRASFKSFCMDLTTA